MQRFLFRFFSLLSAFLTFGVLTPVLAATTATVSSPFHYEFRVDGMVNETGSLNESASPYWWVNSGGELILSGGKGQTMQSDAPVANRWRLAYAAANPLDTDNGLHPQNIFRLVSRSTWQNAQQDIHFKINKINVSATPNRDGYSGVLLFNRYINSQNLYYTGVRMDGTVVIKKKINGVYYTMSSARVYNGTYDRTSNPNLIPVSKWIGLRSKVVNNADGSVSIELYMDKDNTNTWQRVTSARDDGHTYGGAAIRQAASGGLRTDYMDAEFDDYSMTNL